jgi:hypothetical protein
MSIAEAGRAALVPELYREVQALAIQGGPPTLS